MLNIHVAMVNTDTLIDLIWDDWNALKKATVKTRKQHGNLVLKQYSSRVEGKNPPLWWRKEALRNSWEGVILDPEPDGAAMIGLASVRGITYTCYVPNTRHQERFEMMGRVLGINLVFLGSREELGSCKYDVKIER